MNHNILIKNKEKFGKISTGAQAQAERLVHDCVSVLSKHYPGHPWIARMSRDYSTIGIILPNLHPNYGIIIHTLTAQSDPDLKCVVRAGGELLERSFQERGRYRQDPEKLDLSKCPTKRYADRNIKIKKV